MPNPEAELLHADGARLSLDLSLDCDVVIVGSGPAGSAVARTLARGGVSVVVLEEGPYARPEEFQEDAFLSMSRLYRDMSSSLTQGRSPLPFIQGRAVGGTSVVNGAICWRLPKPVHESWLAEDPALGETLPWAELERIFEEIEAELHIGPVDPAVAGPKNLLMAKGADAMGLEHRPIHRNTKGCSGLGRCMGGCPQGSKLSMERTYLPESVRSGAKILSSVEVRGIEMEGWRAVGVEGRAAGGGTVRVRARRAVVLAASAVQTPALLWRSGIRQGPVGEHFQAHPGFSMAGWFPEPVRMWRGATQGHEVTAFRAEGFKLESLGYDLPIVAMRHKGIGRELGRGIDELEHWAHWAVAVRSEAHGWVRPGWLGSNRARVRFEMTRSDWAKARKGLRVLGEMMLAAGAKYVTPGVHGWHAKVTDRAVMARFEEEASWDPRAYMGIISHMFGTCRMGGNPASSVVRPDFRHHAVDRLYVADSSVFPTNLGVNPQVSILALATVCGRKILN